MTRMSGFAIGAGIALWMTAGSQADAQWFSTTPAPLPEIEETVATRHDDISHIDAGAFAQRQADGKKFILLDVRKKDEFDVSHIPGSVQIDPGASASEVKTLIAQMGADPETQIVVYCSVGRRSSQLGSRIVGALEGREVVNLRGGIFGWHNQTRPLENAAGTTDLVHPYNERWGTLIERSEGISYKPLTP